MSRYTGLRDLEVWRNLRFWIRVLAWGTGLSVCGSRIYGVGGLQPAGRLRDLLTFGPHPTLRAFNFWGRSVHTPDLDKKRLYKQ